MADADDARASLTILGRGRLGRGLAAALRARSFDVRLASGRDATETDLRDAAVVLLAAPDPALPELAARIAPWLAPGAVVLHGSGRYDASLLAPCRAAVAAVGAMHPLVSFADPEQPPALRGTSFVIAGDERAVSAATALARAMDARPVHAAVHGPTYHAAAALAANGAAALADIAVRVLARMGLGRREAQRAIGALLRTVGENVERIGTPAALTGPVIRGDAGTVRAHRRALAELDAEARAAYDAVAPSILACARAAGLDEARAAAVEEAVEEVLSEPSA